MIEAILIVILLLLLVGFLPLEERAKSIVYVLILVLAILFLLGGRLNL